MADGLDDLRHVIEELEISSIALPPLGCGHGGLDWDDVRSLIEERLGDLDVVVHLYAPEGAPDAADTVVSTPRPRLTTSTAALVSVIDQYSQVALLVSLIEIQKLMYFLQEAGEDLKLRYQSNLYGPYADNLRHVLKSLEGHQLEGFGDGSKKVREAEPITVLPGGVREASAALAENHQIAERIQRVLELVEGYESAYGLEATRQRSLDDSPRGEHRRPAPHDRAGPELEPAQAAHVHRTTHQVRLAAPPRPRLASTRPPSGLGRYMAVRSSRMGSCIGPLQAFHFRPARNPKS